MKFSAQEEYGLRCLLQIAQHEGEGGITIGDISRAEGLSEPNVAKLLRALRQGGFIVSSRGQTGGYTLARPAAKIRIGVVLAELGGKLFDASFCDDHAGTEDLCTHSSACSIRSLWRSVQSAVDDVLKKMTLADLLPAKHTMIMPTIKELA